MNDKEQLIKIQNIYLKWYNSIQDSNEHSKKALYEIGEVVI